MREKVLARYEERYEGMGPTLAAEKLAEEGLVLDHETLRRWLIATGLWQRARKRGPHRTRRPRKEHFGELVQFDGSHHAWFGPDHPRACLMNLVDDATGRTLATMDVQETTEAAMRTLWKWIERCGIPKALYCDGKAVYILAQHSRNQNLFHPPTLAALAALSRCRSGPEATPRRVSPIAWKELARRCRRSSQMNSARRSRNQIRNPTRIPRGGTAQREHEIRNGFQ